MDLKNALRPHFFKATLRDTLGDDYNMVERSHSFSFAPKDEDERNVHRIILLPPHGYTANAPNLMNAHDEVEKATIEIKGAIRDGKKGLSKLKDCLLLAALPNNDNVSDQDTPYFTFDIDNPDTDLTLETHSAGDSPFHVVKKDGFGFYHNLVNLTDDWLVLELHKTVRPMKEVDLLPHIEGMNKDHADALKRLHQMILLHGDEVFTETPSAIKNVMEIPIEQALPAVGEMLYTRETGRHEACTAFGLILKMAKENPKEVTEYLRDTLEAKTIPPYYATQLIGKIENRFGNDKDIELSNA